MILIPSYQAICKRHHAHAYMYTQHHATFILHARYMHATCTAADMLLRQETSATVSGFTLATGDPDNNFAVNLRVIITDTFSAWTSVDLTVAVQGNILPGRYQSIKSSAAIEHTHMVVYFCIFCMQHLICCNVFMT